MDPSSIRNIPPPAGETTPHLQFTPQLIAKFSLGIVLMMGALYYLAKGREERSLNKMITGGVLALASVGLFAL